MAGRRLAALLLVALALGACAPTVSGPTHCLPPGRTLVVGRVTTPDNRANAEEAAKALINALRETADVIGKPELLTEAGLDRLGLWAAELVGRLQRGGRVTPDEARTLLERFGVNTVVVAELSEYDQLWGKQGKFTRATVDGSAVDLASEAPLWRLRGHAEVEYRQGYGFRFALDQAVQQLADEICPQARSFSISGLLRDWRR